jgi:serine/threonine-protein kinase
MTRERWRQVEAVLDRALAAMGSEREILLSEMCGDDVGLRREVEALLAADGEALDFLDTDAAAFAAPAFCGDEPDEVALPAERLGNYRLVRQIGAGGMSRVFLGERVGDEFEHQVAIKILRAVGLDLDEGAGRFRAERQILAALDHPSIARVLDGGATETGMPYLVMELVDGVPVTDYCADLELEERLDLFIEACEAVQYAHQRLIVHRDLKPSNILVTPAGQLKLLDFGIAKLLAPGALGLNDAAPVTRTGHLLMTPEYAAPEQFQGQDVTTATDVYGLGVLLYELLTGRRPFELAGKSPSQIESSVCHEEPRKPSTVASGGESEQHVRWNRRLPGDLDTIALKALRKEPAERYDSARALADDVRFYREGLPIAARPATASYRVRKFVARNRWGVAAGLVAFVSLAAFAAVMAWQQSVTSQERDRARSAEEQASAINRFLVDEMLGAAAPEVAQGRDVSVLAAAALRIEGAFSDQPALEASVRRTMGELYLSLGEVEEAEEHLRRAHELFRGELGSEHPDTLVAARLLGELAIAQGRYDDAGREVTEIAASQRLTLGPDHTEVLKSEAVLARVDLEKGDYRAAQVRLEELLESTVGDEPPSEARIELEGVLAEVYSRQRRWVEVEAVARRVLRSEKERLGPNHPAVARTLATLGNAQTRNKRYAEGQASLEEALALRRRILGDEHPETLESLRAMVLHHAQREDYPAARRYAETNAQLSHRVYGADHPRTIRADESIGVLHGRMGRADLAEPFYREAARRHEETLGLSHPSTVRSYKNWNSALLKLGKIDEAGAAAQRILTAGRARISEGDEDATFLSDFAFFLASCRPEALRDLEEALALAERAVELTDRKQDSALQTLARVHAELGDLDLAIELQREVLTFPRAVAMMDSERNLIEYLETKGDLEQVETDLREHLERRRVARPADDPILGTSYRRLGNNLRQRGLLERARVEFESAVAQFAKTLPPDDFQRLRAESELGEVLTLLERFDEAEAVLVPAARGLRGRIWFRDETTKLRSQERVAELYRAWGRPRLAAEWEASAEPSDSSLAPPAA